MGDAETQDGELTTPRMESGKTCELVEDIEGEKDSAYAEVVFPEVFREDPEDMSEYDKELLKELRSKLTKFLPRDRGVAYFSTVERPPMEPMTDLNVSTFPQITSEGIKGPGASGDISCLMDLRQFGAKQAFMRFAATTLDIKNEEDDLPEVLYGAKTRSICLVPERIQRLRTQVPEFVSAVYDCAKTVSSDEIVDLVGARHAVIAWIARDQKEQKEIYGPDDISGGLYDPWTPAGYTHVQSLRSKLLANYQEQHRSVKPAPLIDFEEVSTHHALSWATYNSKCNDVNKRISTLEEDLTINESNIQSTENDATKKAVENYADKEQINQNLNICGQMAKILKRLDLLCEETKISQLERRLDVLGTELSLLDGCGIPADEVNPEVQEEWTPEMQLQRIYKAVVECNPLIENITETVETLKKIKDFNLPILTFLKTLHEQEHHFTQLQTTIKETTDVITNLQASALTQKEAVTKYLDGAKAVINKSIEDSSNDAQSIITLSP